jgi:von Willebrand factor type A domain
MKRWRSRLSALRPRPVAVPHADLRSFRRQALRTRVIRIVLTLTLAGLLAGAAVAAAANPGRGRSDIVPTGTTSVLVLDLSKSIIDTELPRVRATFQRLIATDTAVGLVVFSDVAYELLPPGSPASALVPFVRFFTPRNGAYPTNPWQATFRAGTRISPALDLAQEMLDRNPLARGSIVLVSDLETAPSDFVRLAETLGRLRHDEVTVRAVPLRPTDRSEKLFRDLLGPDYLLPEPRAEATGTSRISRTLEGDVPIALVVLGGLLLLGLAANERWCARLALPGPGAGSRS